MSRHHNLHEYDQYHPDDNNFFDVQQAPSPQFGDPNMSCAAMCPKNIIMLVGEGWGERGPRIILKSQLCTFKVAV